MSWITKTAMKTLMPSGGYHGLKGLEDEHLEAFLAKFKREAPLHLRGGVQVASLFVLASPLLTVGTPLPSFLLSDDLRDEHAYKLATHKNYLVRQATMAVKYVAGLAWGTDPDVRDDVGVVPLGPDPGTFRRGDQGGAS